MTARQRRRVGQQAHAPLCKIGLPEGQAGKIMGRSYTDQRGNLNDEKHVQSALLCGRLATSDKGMRNVMKLFKASDLWKGDIIFIPADRGPDLATILARVL